MKRFSVVLAALASLTFAFGSACSPTAPGEEVHPTIVERVVVDASPETRAAIGVETWGVDRDRTMGHTTVRGYDAARRPILAFRERVHVGQGTTTFEATLRRGEREAKMVLESERGSPEVRAVESTFGDDKTALLVVDRIRNDLRTQPARDGATSGGGTLVKSLRPQASDGGGLVAQEGQCLAKSCGTSLTSSAASGADTVANCNGNPSAPQCATSRDEATKGHGKAGKECECGSGEVTRFPVAGPHNLGYDENWATWACDGSNSNSDFHTGAGDANHQNGHLGNDIFGAIGTNLVAVTAGTVAKADTTEASVGGFTITIKDDKGMSYYYAHMQGPTSLGVGQKVAAGDVVGQLGKTGQARSTEAHLHFSMYPNDNYDEGVDPYSFIAAVEKTACQ